MALARKLTSKIYEIQAHAEKVCCLDLGETGRVLVTGGQDRNVNLWAIGENTCFMSLTGHTGSIECVKFAYNDDFVYSADDIGVIRRWDLNAQTMCSTLNGHMKTVKTLDFNPSGEYVVSGSNDTTIRLWDVRDHNKCIKKYRGHVSSVNSVKFSPDGLWIASAGAEGSVIIWDIRESKQITQFLDRTSPVTCIQFHPFEFLLAAGRSDGTVSLYDLESMQKVSKSDGSIPYNNYNVKCITFSENGECLFVGKSEEISVIGWEPDREFDHIESSWSTLGDMKVFNKKLICGSFDKEYVSIHAISIDRLVPFYNPSNTPFNHSQSSRKSFSKGNQKLRLSIGQNATLKSHDEVIESCSSMEGGQSSPNLSIEMVDENEDILVTRGSKTTDIRQTKPFNFPNSYPKENNFDGPSSLKITSEANLYQYNTHADPYSNNLEYSNDISYYHNDSNSHILSNYEPAEVEDFPVNSAQQPDYAPKMDTMPTKPTGKHKAANASNRKTSPPGMNPKLSYDRKLSHVTSLSSMDLHKMEDNASVPKRQITHSKLKRPDVNTHLNKENNAKNRNITVQIITKPPTRSKTSFDLRTPQPSAQIAPTPKIMSYSTDDSSEIQLLTTYHDKIYQELCNRYATLQMIRNSTRSHDFVGALKQAIKINGRSVFVDLLGAILEKTSTWNLDICLVLLPEIYELLQSEHKFHYNRACDTLRVILSNFLPTIQENVDPWGPARSLGVDISREERQRKCIECQQWLIRIRLLPDNQQMGSTLTQLQSLIVNI